MMVVVGIKLLFRPSPVSLHILGYDAPAKSCLNAISRKTVEDPYRPQSNASSSFVCVGKHLLVILLLLGLEGGLGNSVQITLAGLCDAAATFVLVLLENTDLLKSLHDLAVDGAGGVDVVGGARATVLGGTTIPLIMGRSSHVLFVEDRTRGPFADGQHQRSCACRRGGRRQRRGRRTSRCPEEEAPWSLPQR
jgi:hypothetical protein